MPILALLSGIAGALVVSAILWDAFETMLVPRRIGRRVRLTRYFYIVSWRAWRTAARFIRRPASREYVLGFYAPASLILLLVCWAAGLIAGFALLQLAIDGAGSAPARHLGMLLYMSGETFFTLGFGDVVPSSGIGRVLSVLEAGTGFGFLGTVIGYLPTAYNAFSQREIEISLLDARAGSPPTAAEFLRRIPSVGAGTLPDEMLRHWEQWSAQVLETHISFPLLAYYRSQHSNQSWLGALTAVLDASAVIAAGAQGPAQDQARLTFAMARHALVDLAQIFVPRYEPGAPDRLGADGLRRLREHLAGSSFHLPETAEYAQKLASLRLLYEPYAQALAGHLLLELPGWLPGEGRRDNWRGGPWDRQLGAKGATVFSGDDHF